MDDLVSVVIANYNKGNYIEGAVKSVLKQSYTNLEVIIIDDGSSDQSRRIINKIASNDSRVIFRFLSHRGKIYAYNYGISMISGKYVKLWSSDDLLFEGAISKLLEEIHGYDVVCSNTSIVNEALDVIERKYINTAKYLKGINLVDVINGSGYPSGAYLFKRFVIDSIFPIPLEAAFEDWYIYFMLMLNGYKIKYLDQSLSFYRQVNNSAYGGVYNFDNSIMKYRAERELSALGLFHSMLPNRYHEHLQKAKNDLELIKNGKILEAIFRSHFSLKRRPMKLLLKRIYYRIFR